MFIEFNFSYTRNYVFYYKFELFYPSFTFNKMKLRKGKALGQLSLHNTYTTLHS